jgi:hypothetical protein
VKQLVVLGIVVVVAISAMAGYSVHRSRERERQAQELAREQAQREKDRKIDALNKQMDRAKVQADLYWKNHPPKDKGADGDSDQ